MHHTPSSTQLRSSGDFTPHQRMSAIAKADFGRSVIRNAMNRTVRGKAMAVAPLKNVGYRGAGGKIDWRKFSKLEHATSMPADGADSVPDDPKQH